MTVSFEQLDRAFAGRYSIERGLGRGRMAVVYLGRDIKHAREVAIKVFLPELASTVGAGRFLQEMSTTPEHHPAVWDAGCEQRRLQPERPEFTRDSSGRIIGRS